MNPRGKNLLHFVLVRGITPRIMREGEKFECVGRPESSYNPLHLE